MLVFEKCHRKVRFCASIGLVSNASVQKLTELPAVTVRIGPPVCSMVRKPEWP